MRDLVSSPGLSASVEFKTRTSYADVPADYRNAYFFIMTSISDGTPVSLLEAMSSGLPCITTLVGGIPEWITDGEKGILIPPGSPQAVADAIVRLAADPSLRTRLGERARATVVSRGQWNTLMAQVEKDYEQLVNTYRKKVS